MFNLHFDTALAADYKSESQKIYGFEKTLQAKHPENNFVKDKIRQQLQYLRDKGYLTFKGQGRYSL